MAHQSRDGLIDENPEKHKHASLMLESQDTGETSIDYDFGQVVGTGDKFEPVSIWNGIA